MVKGRENLWISCGAYCWMPCHLKMAYPNVLFWKKQKRLKSVSLFKTLLRTRMEYLIQQEILILKNVEFHHVNLEAKVLSVQIIAVVVVSKGVQGGMIVRAGQSPVQNQSHHRLDVNRSPDLSPDRDHLHDHQHIDRALSILDEGVAEDLIVVLLCSDLVVITHDLVHLPLSTDVEEGHIVGDGVVDLITEAELLHQS